MDGEGPFLWFRQGASDGGFQTPPKAGFCVSVFACIWRRDRLLVGRYTEHEAWMDLAGLDPERVSRYATGWTLPGTHLKLGEDPREGGRRVVDGLLGLDDLDLALSEPLVASASGPHNHPDIRPLGDHFDIWFFLEAEVPADASVTPPPWYAELDFVDPNDLDPQRFAREHHEVVDAFLQVRGSREAGSVLG